MEQGRMVNRKKRLHVLLSNDKPAKKKTKTRVTRQINKSHFRNYLLGSTFSVISRIGQRKNDRTFVASANFANLNIFQPQFSQKQKTVDIKQILRTTASVNVPPTPLKPSRIVGLADLTV
jgi:hypothetical protein